MIYDYTRDFLDDNIWDIDNPYRRDVDGHQIYLSNEIENAIPEKHFRIYCEDMYVYINFDTELTSEEKSILDTTVSNHKNNV